MSNQNDNKSNIEGSDFLKSDNLSPDEVTSSVAKTEETNSTAKKSKYGFNKDDRWKNK